MFRSVLFGVGLLSAAVSAKPATDGSSLVQVNLFNDLALYAQYAAAAYCDHNYEADMNKQIRCNEGVCPRVMRANTQVVASFTDTDKTDTSGYIALDHTNRKIMLAVRGSESKRNFATDLNIPLKDNDMCPGCQSAAGYWEAWQEIRDVVYKRLKLAADKYPTYRVVATGHSLGGTIASFAAVELRDSGRAVDIATFGMPRIGNQEMANYISAQQPSKGYNLRVTHVKDSVPALPPQFLGYAHYNSHYTLHNADNDYPNIRDLEAVTVEMDGDQESSDNTAINWNIFSSMAAHKSYFGQMSKCYDDQAWTMGGLLPPNRMVSPASLSI